ncbi:MAG: hypothetical protein ACRCST_13525 [Turicibacter sp.]
MIENKKFSLKESYKLITCDGALKPHELARVRETRLWAKPPEEPKWFSHRWALLGALITGSAALLLLIAQCAC